MDPDDAVVVSANGGISPGDEISYIIQTEPLDTSSSQGPGGWVTFYIPGFTTIVDAEFVDYDGHGSFTQRAGNPTSSIWTLWPNHVVQIEADGPV